MTFEKKWFSYFLWACYAAFACVGFVVVLIGALRTTPLSNPYGQIGIVCLSFILAAGVFLVIRRIIYVTQRKKASEMAGIIREIFFAVLILSAGILIRVHFCGSGSQEAAYFETARVSGESIAPIAYGAQYFYILLLRGIFWIVGNHFTAGIIVQIIFQMAASVLWYFAIRRLAGSVAGLFFLAAVMFFPVSIRESLLYSPRMLYFFLCGIVLLMAGRFLERQTKIDRLRWYSWLQMFVLGIGIGCLVYLDAVGLLFFIPILFLTAVKEKKHCALQLLTVFLGCALAFCFLIIMDTVQSGATMSGIVTAWCTTFSPKGTEQYTWSMLQELMAQKTKMELWILTGAAFLILLGVPAFFVRKAETQTLAAAFTIGAGIFFLMRFGVENRNFDFLFFASFAVLLGTGMQALFAKPEEEDVADSNIETMPNQKSDDAVAAMAEIPETDNGTADSGAKEDVNTPQEKVVHYIDNPLPLPKKHVKKTMGYQKEVLPEQMHYDIDVPDTDDFDL